MLSLFWRADFAHCLQIEGIKQNGRTMHQWLCKLSGSPGLRPRRVAAPSRYGRTTIGEILGSICSDSDLKADRASTGGKKRLREWISRAVDPDDLLSEKWLTRQWVGLMLRE